MYVACSPPPTQNHIQYISFCGLRVRLHWFNKSFLLPPSICVHKHTQYVCKRKTFFAHDEESECRDGDLVLIKECRPLSKKKHFKVMRILEKAESYTDRQTGKTFYNTPYWFADSDH